jgi:hypothetical protein
MLKYQQLIHRHFKSRHHYMDRSRTQRQDSYPANCELRRLQPIHLQLSQAQATRIHMDRTRPRPAATERIHPVQVHSPARAEIGTSAIYRANRHAVRATAIARVSAFPTALFKTSQQLGIAPVKPHAI